MPVEHHVGFGGGPATAGYAFGVTEPCRDRADAIADRLDVPMSVAGVVFALLVLAETVSRPSGGIGTVFAVAGWVLWVAFAAEFSLRIAMSAAPAAYLRRNWWQVLFLLVPFLRFLRVLRAMRAVRAARVGRVLSAAVRSTRTAERRLSGRLASVAATTVVMVLAGSQLLFEAGDHDSYDDALYVAAVATVAGETPGSLSGLGRVVDVVLVTYSVVVFAAVAGAVGAYLLERRDDDRHVNPG